MPQNYILFERIELTSAAASVTFDNIPQSGYTDLKVVASVRTSADNVTAELAINGVKTNMTQRFLQGTGTAASSGNNTSINIMENPSSSTASTFSNSEIYIPNYTSATYKPISISTVSEKNASDAYSRIIGALWSSTASITSLTLNCAAAGNFTQYSTFSIYGLAATGTTPTSSPKASGGNIIQTDGTYWYHAFTSSGRFTPATTLSCDVLQVAGGGAGGNNASGGGGAGGLLYSTTKTFANGTSHTVTIGGGGANQNMYSSSGTNGTDSTIVGSGFTILTATGGGGGQGPVSTPGGSGGSGGGASGYSGSSARGTGTSGQGNNGGTATVPGESGGGGGAGAVGGNGGNNSARTGVGGAGTNAYSSWASATGTGVSGYYAGGGGGGAGQSASSGTSGGAGGGGTGAGVDQNTLATAGTANTGGGGGGTGYGNTSASSNTGGGSGITIIRYAV